MRNLSLLLARGEARLLRLGLLLASPRDAARVDPDAARGAVVFNLQNWSDLPSNLDDPAWLNIGFIVADWGGVLFLISLVVGAVGLRRLRGQRERQPCSGRRW